MQTQSVSYRVFTVFNYTFVGLLALLCIAPLLHILAVSFSSKAAASANLVYFWPVDFTVGSYAKTFGNNNFLISIWIAIQRTVLGTALTMILIAMAAYALSKDNKPYRGRTFFAWYFLFTMLFGGGLIPSYIVVQKLGLLNSLFALILPGAVAVFSLILLINFFRSIPKELEEAALIDGAGQFRTLFTIYIPLSMPAIATLSLFSMVYHWNSWFDGLIYMTDYRKYPLSSFLQTIVVAKDFTKINMDVSELKNISERSLRASQIIIGAVPILFVYPFLQRFFVKGIILGGVKE
ncbi:carbohydrate ABC transporter permease [Cohnella herbarum]|uniref:Carbohydrate ABC transporter permease n=1 Tax=Cohnella herbarum TaxID=2728023 RepID=A0A7Z2VPL9_9BACL|nr:carbohydrate ABC transporter permease [Cohnella herbarum]QJD87153.1 carbohydrate ABC transporter permease [Cohnella herbarum]